MASIITYNQVIDILKNICERHYQINSFYLGRNWELENDDDIVYPVFQVYPESARMPVSNGEYKTIEMRLICKVIDLVKQNESNEQDVHSDCLRIAQDIINEFNQHPFYIRSNASLTGDINITNLEEFEDDFTAGWEFGLTLKLINVNSYCGLPFEEITGYSASGPVSTGFSYSVQYLTCDTVTACTSFQEYVANAVNAVSADTNTYITGFTWSPNTLTASRNDGVNITVEINNFSTLSANTFYSGSTPLETIIANLAVGGNATYVQPGLNTYTGGTPNAPTVNISAATLTYLSANTITASTIFTNTGGKLKSTNGAGELQFDYDVNTVLLSNDNGNFSKEFVYLSEADGQFWAGTFRNNGASIIFGGQSTYLYLTANNSSLQDAGQYQLRFGNNYSLDATTAQTFVSASNSITVNPGVRNSAVIAASGITADTNYTLYTNNLKANTVSATTFYSGSTDLDTIINDYLANYTTFVNAGGRISSAAGAGTYMVTHQQNVAITYNANSTVPPFIFRINSADYPSVNGRTAKLRIRAVFAVNATAPTGTFRVALFPVSVAGGTTGGITYSAGTEVIGTTTSTLTTPSASSLNEIIGSDFSFPSNGNYALGMVRTGTIATNSEVQFQVYVQIHYT